MTNSHNKKSCRLIIAKNLIVELYLFRMCKNTIDFDLNIFTELILRLEKICYCFFCFIPPLFHRKLLFFESFIP